mgnify:CR=1 FL=1
MSETDDPQAEAGTAEGQGPVLISEALDERLEEKRDGLFEEFELRDEFPPAVLREAERRIENVEDEIQEEIDDRVAQMLELIEMPGYEDRMPEQLSGGQAQRVGLARALAPEPEVLLLDEPLSALDEKLREHMQTELTRIQRELGVTTIFVTHNQEEAMTMSDRIVVMNDGHFEQIGSPEEIYTAPESVFVGDFMGKSNLFTGTVSRRANGQATVGTEYGEIVAPADGLTTGMDAELLLRPEDCAITHRDETTPAADNTLAGEVGLVQLIGSIVEYDVETDRGTVTVEKQSSGTIDFERGDPVRVSFDAVDVQTFAGTADESTAEADDVEVAP